MWNFIEKIVYWFSSVMCKLAKRKLTVSMVETIMQFVKFGIIGISNTLLSYAINILVLIAMKPIDVSWDYFVGNIVAFIISVLWSFFWNNRFVFTVKEGETRSIWRTLLRTYIAYGFTGIVLSNVLSWMWVSVLEISKYIAPLLNLFISVPLNFLINKLWAFRKNES